MRYLGLLWVLVLGCGGVSVPALPDTASGAGDNPDGTGGQDVTYETVGDQGTGEMHGEDTPLDIQGIDPTPAEASDAASTEVVPEVQPASEVSDSFQLEVKWELVIGEAIAVREGVIVDTGSEVTSGCKSDADCGSGNYCRFPDGACGGVGTCKQVPLFCVKNLSPVCGCDWVTYDNPCMAAQAHKSIKMKGVCPTPCKVNGDCPSSSTFCKKELGNCLGQGTCKEKPTLCPSVVNRVCGCDGDTYNNECFAEAAGVSVAAPGSCPNP